MTSSSDENRTDDHTAPEDQRGGAVTDEQLPEDLRPTDDNPLAKNPQQEGEDTTVGQPMKADEL
jgi:hypothetical protein